MEMKAIISFVVLLQAIINVVNLATAQFPVEPVYRCRDTGNYTTRTDYARNLRVATNKVAMGNKASGGFYNASWGGNEAAYALAICPSVGVKWAANCTECVTKLSNTLDTKYCPFNKEAIVWGSNCMFRYSDRNIFGVLDNWIWINLPERRAVGDRDALDKALYDLGTRLQRQAAQGDDRRKAALGDIKFSAHNRPLYGAMQCTPDLSKELCIKCLEIILQSHKSCCSGKSAAKMFSPNCFFFYSLEEFSKWKPQ